MEHNDNETLEQTNVQEDLEKIMSNISPLFTQIGEVNNDVAIYKLQNGFPIEQLKKTLEEEDFAIEVKENGDGHHLTVILERLENFSKEQIERSKPEEIDSEKQEKLVKDFLTIIHEKHGLQKFIGTEKVSGKRYSTQVDISKPVSEWSGIARFTFSNEIIRKEILEKILSSRKGSGVVFLTDNRNHEPSILLILNQKCQEKVYSLVKEKTKIIKKVLNDNKIEIIGNFRKVTMHDLGIKVATLKNPKQSEKVIKLIFEQTSFSAKTNSDGEIIVSSLTHNLYHDNVGAFQNCCNEDKVPSLYTSTSLPTKDDILKILREKDHAKQAPFPRIIHETGELMVIFRKEELEKRDMFFEQFERKGIKCRIYKNSLMFTIVGTIPETERITKTATKSPEKDQKVIAREAVDDKKFDEIIALLKKVLVGKNIGVSLTENKEKIKIQNHSKTNISEIRKIIDGFLESKYFSVISAPRGNTILYVVYDENKIINNHTIATKVDTNHKDDMQEIIDFLKSEFKRLDFYKNVRLIGLTENKEKIKIQTNNYDVSEFVKIVDAMLVSKKYNTARGKKGGQTIFYVIYDENKVVESNPEENLEQNRNVKNESTSNNQQVKSRISSDKKNDFTGLEFDVRQMNTETIIDHLKQIIKREAGDELGVNAIEDAKLSLKERLSAYLIVMPDEKGNITINLNGAKVPVNVKDVDGIIDLNSII